MGLPDTPEAEPGLAPDGPAHHTGSRVIASSIFHHKSCPQEMGFLRRRGKVIGGGQVCSSKHASAGLPSWKR